MDRSCKVVRPESARRLFITEVDKHDAQQLLLKTTGGNSIERPCVGLRNIGNTCYMAAALQCIMNQKPLALYFLRGFHLEELKRTNRKGGLALAFAKLTQDMW